MRGSHVCMGVSLLKALNNPFGLEWCGTATSYSALMFVLRKWKIVISYLAWSGDNNNNKSKLAMKLNIVKKN